MELADGAVVGQPGALPNTATFLGVPFAAPPVGPLRWAAPQPVAPWRSGPAYNASSYGPACLQPTPLPQSEDCLTLDVYAPWPPSSGGNGTLLPILLWLHGGSSIVASTSDQGLARGGGERLASLGAVVVAASYRLDVFGWLATSSDDGGLAGNFGLADQRFAMAWAAANGRAFGGDPSRITLWGQSAGVQAAAAHTASPPARGLFRRILLESSYLGNLFPTARAMAVLGGSIAAEAGCAGGGGAAVLACLRALPAAQLLGISGALVDSSVRGSESERAGPRARLHRTAH